MALRPKRTRPNPLRRRAIDRALPPLPAGGEWLWGRHTVLAALANPERKILRVLATEDAALSLTAAAEAPRPEIVSRDSLERNLPIGAIHQGLALAAWKLPERMIEDIVEQAERQDGSIVVVLDQVTDPHNVGAILRTAAAFGGLAVIVPERHSPDISGTLAKAASGAVEHVPLVAVVNLARALAQLKRAGFWIIGLDDQATQPLAALKLAHRVALVLGSEGDGLRRLTRDSCDLIARLPTFGPIASLNVSNAAAVALYEVIRDRVRDV